VNKHAILYAVENVEKTLVAARPATWVTAAWRYVRSAPLTYLWLAVLLVTTIVQHQLTRRELRHLLVHQSTNLHHLASDPLRVLFSSLLWIDGRYWVPYLLLFSVFMAPAERWLGQIRWATVGLTAHVGATYISESVLYLEIQHHLVPARFVNARDIGVSYFLVGVMAVLTYRIAHPWRWGYLAGLILFFGLFLIFKPGFTGIGHLSAVFIGLCCYPLARGRAGPLWNPAHVWTALRRSRARPRAA
jgi:hypothetical protein